MTQKFVCMAFGVVFGKKGAKNVTQQIGLNLLLSLSATAKSVNQIQQKSTKLKCKWRYAAKVKRVET